VRSSSDEGCVLRDLAVDVAGKEAGLNLEHATVADPVIEAGVGGQRVHSLLVGAQEAFASLGLQGNGGAHLYEIVGRDHAVVDCDQDGAVCDNGAKRFHEVKGKGRATEARLVIKADVRIKPHGPRGDGEVFCKQGVSQRQERINGVSRGTAVAVSEVKGKGEGALSGIFPQLVGLEHPGKVGEVEVACHTLDAPQGLQGIGGSRLLGQAFECGQHVPGRLDVIALEQGSLVLDFTGDECAGDFQTGPRYVRESKLVAAQEDVLQAVAPGQTVKPSAHGKPGYGDVFLAEGLDGLCGDLNVSEDVDLIHVHEPDLFDDLVLVANLQDTAGDTDAEPLGVEVERFFVVASGDESADRR